MCILRTSLSSCVLATIEVVELSVTLCSKMVGMAQRTLCNPLLGGYGLHGRMESHESILVHCMAYKINTHTHTHSIHFLSFGSISDIICALV